MEIESQTEVKYPIIKEFKEPLKIFFLCARPMPGNMTNPERFIGIIAYRHEDAFKKAIDIYAPGGPASGMAIISHGDCELIENIFRNINTSEISIIKPIIAQEVKIEETNLLPESKKMAFATWETSLIMCAKEYVKNDADRKELERIIETITIKNDKNLSNY